MTKKTIKKGVPPYSNLVNLKSNTMKNTVQIYELFLFTQTIRALRPQQLIKIN